MVLTVDTESNFSLRPFNLDDAVTLSGYANNVNVAKFLNDAFPHPYAEEDARKFIDYAMSGDPIHIFAIDIDGGASGGMGIHPQQDIMRKNAELGYWLAQPFWGQGIITSLIPLIVKYGFEYFDIDRIYARPFGNNPASQRVLEKCGFQLEARIQGNIYKQGEVLDELIYAIRR
ncbi:MAG: GNAT family N-acetyltransferase [Saprospiraceae bacterium]|nr:GNAT family N-acetyltransferase [Saprospiraceae bacterium]